MRIYMYMYMYCSSSTDNHLLRRVASAGGGNFESFDAQAKSRWPKKAQQQVERAGQSGLVNVSVDWQLHDKDAPRPLQAPHSITSLFNGSRQARI